jgi:amino acid transporter
VAVSVVFPWGEIVAGRLGTEAAFERAFGSRAVARIILLAALLSLLKIFNGNFVAATRLTFAIGRRGLVHRSLGAVHARHGTPTVAIALVGLLTAAAACLGDALLVPITEVGSLAAGVGWLSTCAAYLARTRETGPQPRRKADGRAAALAGAVVSALVILMKVLPIVPGSFRRVEWIAFGCWMGLGMMFWISAQVQRSKGKG